MISVVVPVHNEEKNVRLLHKRLLRVLSKLNQKAEIIFVDDGSDDNTFEELKKLRPATVIKFDNNYGQSAALDAGLQYASGNVIISLDGDLQNDPGDIPLLLEELEKGYDVVCGWRFKRKDNLRKKVISKLVNHARRLFFMKNIHDFGCTLRAYRKQCIKQVRLDRDFHIFLPLILKLSNAKISEIRVKHNPRKHGKTHYSSFRIIRGIPAFAKFIFHYFTGKELRPNYFIEEIVRNE